MKINSINSFLKYKGFTKIPMERSKIGHFVIKAKLNGKNGKFILDTGASHTVVDDLAAEKFNLKFLEKKNKKAGGLGTSELSVRQSSNNRFTIYNFIAGKRKISVMDLSHVNKALSKNGAGKVDGVIGADLLKKYNAIINYNEKALYLK